MLYKPAPMHIPDGFLSVTVAVILWIISAAIICHALKRSNEDLGERQGPLRGWLATVLRRLAAQGRRESERRRRRERRVAVEEAQPATADVVARTALHGYHVQTVLALH